MASGEKLREQIADIVQRPYNVRFKELDRILKAIGCCEPRKTKHGWIYKIPGFLPLILNEHSDGRNNLPAYCVADFKERMIQLGLYE